MTPFKVVGHLMAEQALFLVHVHVIPLEHALCTLVLETSGMHHIGTTADVLRALNTQFESGEAA
jgi:hypothetical protein